MTQLRSVCVPLSTLIAFLSCSPTPPEAPRVDERRIVVIDSPKGTHGSYLFAVRSRLSGLGIVRADGFNRQATEALGKTLAQELDKCVTRELSHGGIEAGATKVDVSISKNGRIAHVDVSSEPQSAHAGALLCLVSPLHAIGFEEGPDRLISIDALWGTSK